MPTESLFQHAPIIADLDADGKGEVVVALTHGIIHAFHHAGRPVPGWPIKSEATRATVPAAGDIDGDGGPEVVLGAYGVDEDVLYAYSPHGRLMPAWPIRRPWIGGAEPIFHSPLVVDVDGDGRADVLAAGSSAQEGDGAGYVLQAFRFDGSPIPFCRLTASAVNQNQGFAPSEGGAASADLRGDGTFDLIWSDGADFLYAWKTGLPTRSALRPWSMTGADPRHTNAAPAATSAPPLEVTNGTSFGATSAGKTLTRLVRVKNNLASAVWLGKATFSGSQFRFTGGAYPGKEGTCRKEFFIAGRLCQLEIQFTRKVKGSASPSRPPRRVSPSGLKSLWRAEGSDRVKSPRPIRRCKRAISPNCTS